MTTAVAPVEYPCPSCDVWPFATAEQLAAHLAADACAEILNPTWTKTRLGPIADGRFEVVENGWGGTTTKRVAPERPATTRSDVPTERQASYVRSLLAERAGSDAAEAVRRTLNDHRVAGTLTKREMSKAIDTLRAIPRAKRSAPVRVTEDGFYADDDGTVWKVQESEAGHLYASRLVPHSHGEWIYERGAIAKLRPEHKLDLERAKQFGALYGFCCACGRTLRNPASIEAGIGPICASKF